MTKARLISAGTALALTGALWAGPGVISANAAPPQALAAAQPAQTTLPVTGTLPDGTQFTGALSNLTTSVVDGVLTLSGTITGTGLPAGGTTFTAPIQDLAATDGCRILTLDLGPLNLDLLGLVVDLSPISLDVTAVPGAGNLLGNLLCAVAGLLDGPGGALNGVVALLNRLLTGLGL
ncbi:ABC transporter substrate-binding protein [Oryzobacter sp. R7]|uniref:ABC transporter substrate-binding protein n=1 Tax=Oryzobacter faecalis TaxID=3388656 RepID=UPI00398CC28E